MIEHRAEKDLDTNAQVCSLSLVTRCPVAAQGSACKEAITGCRSSTVDLQNCIPKSEFLYKLTKTVLLCCNNMKWNQNRRP